MSFKCAACSRRGSCGGDCGYGYGYDNMGGKKASLDPEWDTPSYRERVRLDESVRISKQYHQDKEDFIKHLDWLESTRY